MIQDASAKCDFSHTNSPKKTAKNELRNANCTVVKNVASPGTPPMTFQPDALKPGKGYFISYDTLHIVRERLII